MQINFSHYRQPNRRYTFEMPKLAKWILEHTQRGNVLNVFAGKTRLYDGLDEFKETRIDLDASVEPDYNMDSYDFCKMAIENGWKYNTIIMDPPYNLRKAMEKYDGRYISSFQKIKELIPLLCFPGTNVINCGYSSVVMGRTYGFMVQDICLINHGGSEKDTVITNEIYLPQFKVDDEFFE